MKKQKVKICLTMIVKNEADRIEKCLKAVAPFISYYVIVDTGSSDNTIEIIKKTMDSLNINGEIYEREWINFGYNRTESLELSKNKCDYRWIIDADDIFKLDADDNPFANIDIKIDAYQVKYKLQDIEYYRTQIVRSTQNWKYVGVLHEYLDLPKSELNREIKYGNINNCHVIADISPLKRANSIEEKYANDAKILEQGLIDEPDNTRYMFYLAQSYRDSNQFEKSIEAYQKRAEAGGWEEEVYYSLYMIGKLKEILNYNSMEVIDAYSKAWEYRPERLEAVYHLMVKCRSLNRHLLSFIYGDTAIKVKGTKDTLFIEPDIWKWKFIDEYSLAAYYIGNPEISYNRTLHIIQSDNFNQIDENDRKRILDNFEYYKKAVIKKTGKKLDI